MSKPLPLDDFRAVRIVLEPEDFALGSDKPDPPPSDLVQEKVWHHLVDLADDVSIRTSNRFGTMLKDVSEFCHEFVCLSLAIQALVGDPRSSAISESATLVSDDLQASIYAALTGYYRLSFAALRGIVDNMTIGLEIELSGDRGALKSWQEGKDRKFGKVADVLHNYPRIKTVEDHLRASIRDDFFRQPKALSPADPGGFARRLFNKLSKYSHGGPGFSDADLRQSNGPVFVPSVLDKWVVSYLQSVAYGIMACKLALPELDRLDGSSNSTIYEFMGEVLSLLPEHEDGSKLFDNLPDDLFEPRPETV